MINQKSVLAIIPARGGSKGLPKKNILKLGGKPLIAWTIEAGKASKYIDRLILSSEDKQIISIAKKWGCEVPFIRPFELAQDKTPAIDAVLHAIETVIEKYDYVLLLQPTSPFRSVFDIDRCIEFCIEKNAPFCVSVVETSENPYWMYSIDKENKLTPLIKTNKEIYQRQLASNSFVLNGAIYVAKVKYLIGSKSFLTNDTIAFQMPTLRSVDIDSEMDFLYAEFIQNKLNFDLKDCK